MEYKTTTLKARERYWNSFSHYMQEEDLVLSPKTVNDWLVYVRNEKHYAPTTMWTVRSHIIASILEKYKIDYTDQLPDITKSMKARSRHHVPRQSRVFAEEDIRNFLANAPDTGIHLLYKVALICGVCGLCRKSELKSLTFGSFKKVADGTLVSVLRKKCDAADAQQTFLIPKNGMYGCFEPIFERYKDEVAKVASLKDDSPLFFGFNEKTQKFRNQPMGKNFIAEIPEKIASFLELDHPDEYTGHAMRGTGATIMAANGISVPMLQKAGGWKSPQVALHYSQDSFDTKVKISEFLQKPETPETPEMKRPCFETPFGGIYLQNCEKITIVVGNSVEKEETKESV